MARRKQDDGMNRYSLSFTAGAFLPNDCVAIAETYLKTMSWDETYAQILAGQIFVSRRISSAKRIGGELIKRLKFLTDAELMRLTEVSFEERNAWLWVAICRCYRLIGEFASEVIRDRFIIGQSKINRSEYEAFYANKAQYAEELGAVSEATYAKIRSVVFKLAYEAGILEKNHTIIPANLLTLRTAMIPVDEYIFFPVLVVE